MITAEAITDEQIRELREASSEDGSGVIDSDGEYLPATEVLFLCDSAIEGESDHHRALARARCAEILNARAEGK